MGPLLAFALAGTVFGLADREIRVFERAAAKEIKSRLQGADARVSVRAEPDGIAALWGSLKTATITASRFSVDGLPLFTEPDRSRAGRCGKLVIDLSDFRLRGLRVESLHAEIPACRYDLGLALHHHQFRLSRSGLGRGTVRLRQADLAEWIVKRFPEIKSATVRVERGVVWVEGYGEFLIVKTPFEVIASLGAVDGTKLQLTEPKVWFDWKPADASATNAILQTLNPIVDLDRDLGLLDAVKVDRIRLEGGVLEAQGATKIPIAPKPSALSLSALLNPSTTIRFTSGGESSPRDWSGSR